MLLNAGCNRESSNIIGYTPLHHAISKVVDQDQMREDLFGNSNTIIIKSRKHYYSAIHKQIALNLIDAGADINNQKIQIKICQKRDYGLMVKVLKMKPKNLHPDTVTDIWSGEISDPIATDFLMLYFFNYAIENEDHKSFIIDKLSQVLHCAGNINKLNGKIGRVIKRCEQKFYSWYKHDYYQKIQNSFVDLNDFDGLEMKVKKLSNDNITRFYQRIVTPLFSGLKAVKSISSPLNYLQSELERYYDKKEDFESIPHTPKILEFLESKDSIKLASVSKNPFALFFSITTSNPQPLEHHIDQVENSSTITGEYDANQNSEY